LKPGEVKRSVQFLIFLGLHHGRHKKVGATAGGVEGDPNYNQRKRGDAGSPSPFFMLGRGKRLNHKKI
jgi:hypothetical protein